MFGAVNGFETRHHFIFVLKISSISQVHERLKKVHEIQTNACSLAAIVQSPSGERGVATWGNPGCGGDSRAVQDQLRHVRALKTTHSAFAAILEDGRVVSWGNPLAGAWLNQVPS